MGFACYAKLFTATSSLPINLGTNRYVPTEAHSSASAGNTSIKHCIQPGFETGSSGKASALNHQL